MSGWNGWMTHAARLTLRAVAASIVLIGAIAGPAAGEESRMVLLSDPEQVKASFKLVGPHVESVAEYGPSGLTVRLPSPQPGRPQVGAESKFGVVGDFSVTAAYDISVHEKPARGYGSGVMIRLIEAAERPRRIFLSRFYHPQMGQVFSTNVSTPKSDGVANDEKYIPAAEANGRLRIEREGSTVRFLAAAGDSEEFSELRTVEFGEANLAIVGLLVDTGNAAERVEALLKSIEITADELPVGAIPTKEVDSWWQIWQVLTGVAIAVAAMGLYWRRRARRSQMPREESAPSDPADIEVI